MQIKDYAGDAADLGLYCVVEEDVLGQKLEHELIPRGKDTPVTNANKLMYVYLSSHWHISRISGTASHAFSRGLSKVVPIQFLRMFTVAEVNEVRPILLSGCLLLCCLPVFRVKWGILLDISVHRGVHIRDQ